MYFDTLTLATIADELQKNILGGRIQRVLLPDPMSIGLEIYARQQRHQLLVSANPKFARIHLITQKISRGVDQATPLLLLLRKHVLGGRIVAMEQPPLERVLILSIVKEIKTRNHQDAKDAEISDYHEDESHGEVPDSANERSQSKLIIETMERRSNIILVDEEWNILESVKRVTPQMSLRVILPQHRYSLPPSQEKRDPRNVEVQDITDMCNQGGSQDIRKAIVQSFLGVSPLAAREAVYRAVGGMLPEDEAGCSVWATNETYKAQLAESLQTLFTAPHNPSLVQQDDHPIAYAAYELTHLAGDMSYPPMSVALETFFDAQQQLTAHRHYRNEIAHHLQESEQRLQRQLERLTEELERAKNLEQLRWEGEMILAFLHTIQHGQQTLQVEGTEILLDHDTSPLECAQRRFQKYNKAKSGLTSIAERMEETKLHIADVGQLITLLECTEEREQIEQIANEAREQGFMALSQASNKPRKQQRMKKVKPLHLVSRDGFDIYVGRSATQNDEVTFRIGRPDDVWFHVRGMPGAHVIVRAGTQNIPESTLYEAAGLAAYYSRARSEQAVDVDMTYRRYVRRVSGNHPGLVTLHQTQTLRVSPCAP